MILLESHSHPQREDRDGYGGLLKYPCSYLIYSAAFDALPAQAKAAIYARLADVLDGRERTARYARLSPADRQALTEILRDTKPDFTRR